MALPRSRDKAGVRAFILTLDHRRLHRVSNSRRAAPRQLLAPAGVERG
jgi:hypothetical protein